MDIQKTIPAIAEQVVTKKIKLMVVDFSARTAVFVIEAQGPNERLEVSFDEIIPLITSTQKNGFLVAVRTAVSLALNVPLADVPADIFA